MAGEKDPTASPVRRGVSEVIEDLVTENEFDEQCTTDIDPRGFCKYCKTPISKNQSIAGALDRHAGPCGLPCLGGGVPVGTNFHCDRCPICTAPDRFPDGTVVP